MSDVEGPVCRPVDADYAEPFRYGQHYIVTKPGQPMKVLGWNGEWMRDYGTATVARFGNVADAQAVALTTGTGRRPVKVWPDATGAWGHGDDWWITGEAENAGMEPGNWPFMVCTGNGAIGHPYSTVAMGIQNPADAHLIRSAPVLQHALRQCLAILDEVQGDRPMHPQAMADLHAARDLAKAAMAMSRGEVEP